MTGEGRPQTEVLKVSATSKPVAVAGAIAGVIRSKGRVEVQAIGAGAINQAIKAIDNRLRRIYLQLLVALQTILWLRLKFHDRLL